MRHTLTFADSYDYDPAGLGIDVPLTLSAGARQADVWAKIDCGSTYCVFRRATGLRLGCDIERLKVPAGRSRAGDHHLRLHNCNHRLTRVVFCGTCR